MVRIAINKILIGVLLNPLGFFCRVVLSVIRPVKTYLWFIELPIFKRPVVANVSRTVVIVLCSCSGLNGYAAEDTVYNFAIPAIEVEEALKKLATQTSRQLFFSYKSVNSQVSTAVSGRHTVESALDILLKDTDLSGRLTKRGVILVTSIHANNNTVKRRHDMKAKKSFLAATIAFFSGVGAAQVGLAREGAATEESDGWMLEEIVVTAGRREKSLNDTAISVSAVGSEEIARRNLTEMNDYLRTVPGVTFMDQGVGRNAVVIRGISTNPEQEGGTVGPTVGIYFAEVPLSGTTVTGGSPDLKMIDLERVEVLRGPQGTLFGSGSLGGVVRNIPKAPDLLELEGSIKAGYSKTDKEGGDNTKFEGVVNVPIVDDMFAVRAVAYRHDTSGYIKNVAGTQLATDGPIANTFTPVAAVAANGGASLYQNHDDVGNVEHTGARIAARWDPTDALSMTLQYVTQDVEQDGIPYAQLNIGGYNQASLSFGNTVPGVSRQGLEDEIDITNLVVEYDLGWASLLSSSAWSESDSALNRDATSFLSGVPAGQVIATSTETFMQELRLVSQLEGPFQYIAGMYYEDRDGELMATNYLTGGTTTSVLGATSVFKLPVEQLAFYGELSYDITEQLELTVGARSFDYDRSRQINGGAPRDIDESDTNFKANLSYKPSEDTLVYAQWAEGFRLGFVNGELNPSDCDVNNDGILDGTNTPITEGFDSDSTENFELGAKLGFLDSRLQVNASVYRVDWQDIPLFVLSGKLPSQPVPVCNAGITANAGEARSEGFELETTYQLNQQLRVSLGGAYTDAELTKVALGVPPSFSKGDRLPSTPEYTVNFGLQYEFNLSGNASYVHLDYAYVSEFFGTVGEEGDKGGDYRQVNMNAGIDLDKVSIEFFAHNLTNEDEVTAVGVTVPDTRAYRLRPRTIGLNLIYQL